MATLDILTAFLYHIFIYSYHKIRLPYVYFVHPFLKIVSKYLYNLFLLQKRTRFSNERKVDVYRWFTKTVTIKRGGGTETQPTGNAVVATLLWFSHQQGHHRTHGSQTYIQRLQLFDLVKCGYSVTVQACLCGYMNWHCEEPGWFLQTLNGRSPIGYYAVILSMITSTFANVANFEYNLTTKNLFLHLI